MRGELSALLGEVGASVPPSGFVCPAGEFAAGLPEPSRFGANGARLARLVSQRSPVMEAEFLGGTLFFTLEPSYYDKALRSVELPLPTAADCGESEEGYAMARMLAFSRKGGEGCPRLQSAERALWLALGVLDRDDPRRVARILKLTADAVSELGKELPPRLRREALAQAGEYGRVMAALLFFGMEVIRK